MRNLSKILLTLILLAVVPQAFAQQKLYLEVENKEINEKIAIICAPDRESAITMKEELQRDHSNDYNKVIAVIDTKKFDEEGDQETSLFSASLGTTNEGLLYIGADYLNVEPGILFKTGWTFTAAGSVEAEFQRTDVSTLLWGGHRKEAEAYPGLGWDVKAKMFNYETTSYIQDDMKKERHRNRKLVQLGIAFATHRPNITLAGTVGWFYSDRFHNSRDYDNRSSFLMENTKGAYTGILVQGKRLTLKTQMKTAFITNNHFSSKFYNGSSDSFYTQDSSSHTTSKKLSHTFDAKALYKISKKGKNYFLMEVENLGQRGIYNNSTGDGVYLKSTPNVKVGFIIEIDPIK